jgi:hypothetical protein
VTAGAVVLEIFSFKTFLVLELLLNCLTPFLFTMYCYLSFL